MKNNSGINGITLGIAIICICLSSVTLLHGTLNKAAVPVEPTAVGVIDWLKVTEDLNSWKDIKAGLNNEKVKLEQELDTRKNKLRELKDSILMLPEGSDARRQQENQYGLDSVSLKSWTEFNQNNLVARELEEQLKIYQAICAAVDEVARQEGYKIIIWDDSTSKQIDLRNLQDSAQLISTRHVLYTDNSVDITQLVVEYMNR